MPKIVDAAAQRREIREAARGVFARKGVRGTGLAQVADAAGMGRSSLYHYYPDKSTLVRDLVKDLLAEEEALFASAASAPGSALDKLERLAEALPWALREWAVVGRLVAELRASDGRRFRPFFRRIRAALARVVAQGQADGSFDRSLDPSVVATTVIGAIDGILLQHLVDPNGLGDLDALCVEVNRALRKMLLA